MKTLITKKGKEKFIAAETSETKVEFEKYGLGSGLGVSEEQTTLKDEKYTGLINSVTPSEGIITVELSIPHDVGNFAINEIGLYDKTGDLIVVSEYTGMTSSGAEGDVHIVSISISISNTDTATIVVDPSKLMATQEDVSNAIKKHVEQENPHKVTKSQVGLSAVDDVKQATKTEFSAHVKQIASVDKLGHVKVGAGLSISDDGTLKVTSSPKLDKVYTVIIDETNSNPETALTYADDAIDLQPESDEFLEFLGAKPCLLKEGKVIGYLDPNNFSKFEDGSAADITSGNAGDVMIEFPKRGINIQRKGTNLYVSMADELDNPNFSYLAHTKGDEQVDNIYIGAYKGFELGGKLRSLSGKTPTVKKTIGGFRVDAQANGKGYQQSQWHQLVYRQVAYILYAKNLDSQTAIGRGYVDGNNNALTTGSTDKLGMFYGETTGKKPVKVFGIEDFWGNVFEWVDGLVTSSVRDILITKSNDDYNDGGNGYQQYDKCFAKSGYVDKVVGDEVNGFLPNSTDGSSSTFYADNCAQSESGGKASRYGGAWAGGSSSGVFSLDVSVSPVIASDVLSARLSYS